MYCTRCGKSLKPGEEVVRVTTGFVASEPVEDQCFFQTLEPSDYYRRDCLLVVVRYFDLTDR